MLKLALVLLVIFCPLAIDLYLPAMPQMASELNSSITHIQTSITVFMLCVGLAQLILGPLSDRFGRRKIAIFGVLTYLLGALCAAFAETVTVLIFARIIQGIGAAATFVSTFALVRDNYNANKSAQVISYLNGIVCFIPALAPILGAWLTLQFGWQSNFYFLAGFALIGLAVLVFAIPKRAPESHTDKAEKSVSYWQIFTHPTFLFNATICMLAMGAILAFVAQAPNYLINQHGLSEQRFTFWFSINATVSIIASFLAPQLIKRATSLALMCGLILMVMAASLVVVFQLTFANVASFMCAIFIGSVGFSFTMGAAAGNALAPFKQHAGKASALLGMMQMSGAGLIVSLTQYLPLAIPYIIALHLLSVLPFLINLKQFENTPIPSYN
ncbi:multidrug effflux MFS transporter [Pseudoalteromonas sp. G4]|uniref:multidrug effflux MFS transporter n=1 Tax=Pseudoalteromonas sp. G4 TaxID=2992761 RepID=UPI00237D97F5|nr:multidrug effflux MFS transporter [Pseudoalteromonas sp. G4]MDE3271130.1 multidrug effflux MFS transporter [Pseudoalteromonas sp. G4]